MPVPDFSPGEVLTAAAMDSISAWLVSTTTIGTGVTSVPVNNCFSSNYDNYRIEIYVNDTNGANSHEIQLSGNTGSNYFLNATLYSWGSATLTGFGPAVRTNWIVDANTVAGTPNYLTIELKNPFLTRRTFGFSIAQSGNGNSFFNLMNTTSTSSTGFTLSKAGNTMTGGTIRVYGLRN